MNKKVLWGVGLIICWVLSGTPLLADEAGNNWLDRITLIGAVEFEAGFESIDPAEDEGEDSSDFFLATVDVGIEAQINDFVSGSVLFSYETDEDVIIDEALIVIDGGEKCPFDLIVGKFYLPFGSFESYMISDPLTLDIGEVHETALQVGIESHDIYGSVFVFNGDVDEADEDDDHINNFGANAGYVMESDAVNLNIGLSYINNLIEADSWDGVLDDEDWVLSEFVPGVGAQAIFTTGPVVLIAEYTAALDDIEWLDAEGTAICEDAISAWNVEAGYSFALAGKEAAVAVGYQGTDKAYNRLAETRYVGSFGIGIYQQTTLTFEYLHDIFENKDETDTLTAQLAIEF